MENKTIIHKPDVTRGDFFKLTGISQATCPNVPGCGAEPNLSRLLTQTIEKVTLRYYKSSN